jgi:hypothetical protein
MEESQSAEAIPEQQYNQGTPCNQEIPCKKNPNRNPCPGSFCRVRKIKPPKQKTGKKDERTVMRQPLASVTKPEIKKRKTVDPAVHRLKPDRRPP